MLDQLNKNLNLENKNAKDEIFNDMESQNKESSMLILSRIWNKWAPRETLVKCSKRVGVTTTELNVEYMQEDKFERASNLLNEEAGSSNSYLAESPLGSVLSPNKIKNSVEYWKDKFEQAQNIIRELSEKSIALDEVPGLLSVRKVKPAAKKKSVRVTNVNGSMRAKDKASQVKVIKKKKTDAEKAISSLSSNNLF